MQSTDPTIWRTHDPEWMAMRSEEWRNVLHRLREPYLRINRPQMQQLKSYFFTGAHCPIEERMTFGEGNARLYVWWLHPVEQTEYLFPESQGGDLDSIRRSFQKLYNSLLKKSRELNGDTYGVMGGRELSLMRALNPGLDWREPHSLGGYGVGRRARGGECLSPYDILQKCIGATGREIRSEDYLAYSPGVVLWDHLNYALEHDEIRTWISKEVVANDPSLHNEPFVLQNKKRVNGKVRVVLKDLLTFFDRDPKDAARQRPYTVALVEELLARYERRDFCDNLLRHWDAAKKEL